MQEKQQKKKKTDTSPRQFLFWILIFVVLFLVLSYYRMQPVQEKRIRYDTFLEELKRSNVKIVYLKANQIRGELKEKAVFFDDLQNKEVIYQHFKTANPFRDDTFLQQLLNQYGVRIVPEPEVSFWTQWVFPAIPLLLIFGIFWFFLFKQVQMGGNRALSFGKSKAKLVSNDHPKTTFGDVAGADEPKQELQEIIAFL